MCNRCISTGRTCDGYGIWGGGGNYYGQRQNRPLVKRNADSPPKSLATPIAICTAEEKLSFDWFVCRTLKKIPGIFTLALWESLVIPASLSEPAVLHALLSVSYAHYNGTMKIEQNTKDDLAEAECEPHLLRHYVKATHALSCCTTSKADVRITLISCLLFVYLECLRGHFRTAQAHVLGGLRVLQHWRLNKLVPSKKNHLFSAMLASKEEVDNWIAEAFSRLHIQICLLNPRHLELVVIATITRVPLFANINEAWQSLESILYNITALEQELYLQGNNDSTTPSQRQRQVCITEDLSWWQRVFDKSPLHDHNDPRKAIAALVLSSYHAMAAIMIKTCLSRDQMQYDKLNELFHRILCYSSRSWSSRSPQRLPGQLVNMPRSIVDIGWIPPLYYTAINCRNPVIRLHAIRLLESTSHREGFWDVRIATAVARMVMQIEQCARYQPAATGYLPLDQLPNVETCSAAVIPAEQRLSLLEVILPDSSEESTIVKIEYERRQQEFVVSLERCWSL